MSKEITELIYKEVQILRKETKDGFRTMNGRVRKVEEYQNKQKGVIAALLTGVPALSWLASYFGVGHHAS